MIENKWPYDESLSWDRFFIEMAMLAASKSKDPSTKVGVVLVRDNSVLAIGFNGFPRGVRERKREQIIDEHYRELPELDEERWARPLKYRLVCHAERNAIDQCARLGIATLGASMYFNTDPIPCSDCTKAIIQAGVKEVVGRKIIPFGGVGKGTAYHCGEWEHVMLHEGGVAIREIADFAPDYRYTNPNRV